MGSSVVDLSEVAVVRVGGISVPPSNVFSRFAEQPVGSRSARREQKLQVGLGTAILLARRVAFVAAVGGQAGGRTILLQRASGQLSEGGRWEGGRRRFARGGSAGRADALQVSRRRDVRKALLSRCQTGRR